MSVKGMGRMTYDPLLLVSKLGRPFYEYPKQERNPHDGPQLTKEVIHGNSR